MTNLKNVVLTLIAASLVLATTSVAAKVQVEFVEPDKFRDIQLSGKSKSKSIEQVQRQLSELFTEVSDKVVGEQEQLNIKVTNIDLAGYIEHFYGPQKRNMRIIRDPEFFRLEFDYELVDANGTVKKSGSATIKELADTNSIRVKRHDFKSVGYMHDDVKNWVKHQFAQ